MQNYIAIKLSYIYSGIPHTPLQVVTDVQSLKVLLPLTASLTKYSCPTSRSVMSNGEEEGMLVCVVGVEVVLPY